MLSEQIHPKAVPMPMSLIESEAQKPDSQS